MYLKDNTVDFDFGDNGEIDGFDSWRLINFADKRLKQYGFSSEKELESCFNAEVAAGSLIYSGYILYHLSKVDA